MYTKHADISKNRIFRLEEMERTNLDLLHCKVIKRAIDLVLGGSLAIVLLPVVIPVAGLFITLESRGPIFFVQKRTGKNKRTFFCYKFRTMVLNEEANRKHVVIADSRITRSGRILRRYFIDELPQLINVVMGNMSLVGPRPHMLRHNVEFARKIGNYHIRHMVKPGLTGLAQMRGYHGLISNDQDLINRVLSDVEYIRDWTLYSDLNMFYKTVHHIFKTIAGKK